MREPVTRTIYNNYCLWETYPDEYIKEVLIEDGYTEEEITDDMIWNTRYSYDEYDWEDAKITLTDFFDGETWILRGTNGLWYGRVEAGTIFTDFMEIFYKATKDCDYINIYDENGHFYLECSHHDGTNCYEIKKVTDKGIAYLENWENNWNDKRTEQYIHDKIMEKYSVLPNFAHKVYGCPKVEYKKVTA